eukprot:COSAG05_NODE_26056_length_191_cov_32.391304_1_plen_38_part_01
MDFFRLRAPRPLFRRIPSDLAAYFYGVSLRMYAHTLGI